LKEEAMQPSILLSTVDFNRLEQLADGMPRNHAGASALLREIARADIADPWDMPPSVVTMNSTVRFVIENTGEQCTLTLTYPRDMEPRADQLSVLSPVGTALIGLAVGDSIEWPHPSGIMLSVRVLELVYQPERAGAFHL
jgi:regulator of nucleoside diphosphate kinase